VVGIVGANKPEQHGSQLLALLRVERREKRIINRRDLRSGRGQHCQPLIGESDIMSAPIPWITPPLDKLHAL
jgi:hypothetical protein